MPLLLFQRFVECALQLAKIPEVKSSLEMQ